MVKGLAGLKASNARVLCHNFSTFHVAAHRRSQGQQPEPLIKGKNRRRNRDGKQAGALANPEVCQILRMNTPSGPWVFKGEGWLTDGQPCGLKRPSSKLGSQG